MLCIEDNNIEILLILCIALGLLGILGIILSEQDRFLGPGNIKILTKQDPVLNQVQEKKPIPRFVMLKTRIKSGFFTFEPQIMLYEQEDFTSSTLLAANNTWLPSMPLMVDHGRTGINIRGNMQNTTLHMGSWPVQGIECKALNYPGIIYVDSRGRPIQYNGNKMFIPN